MFSLFPTVLKLSEHGTFRTFAPAVLLDGGADDDQMEGDYGRPANFSLRRQTQTRTSFFSSSTSVRLQSLPGMPEYQNKSPEELRYEDYLLNRNGCAGPKAGMSNKPEFSIPAAGQPLFPFPANYGRGAPWPPFQSNGSSITQTQSPFSAGSGSLFGTTPTFTFPTNTFTSPAPTTSAFPTNVFGSNSAPATSAFQTNAFANTSMAPAAGSLFGNPATTTAGWQNWLGGNVLGSSSTQPSTNTTGLFGTTPTWTQPSTPLFPNSTTQWYTPPKPATNAFGTSTPPTNPFCFTPTAQTGSIFGTTATPQANSVFGTPTPASQTGTFFGTPTHQGGSIFGTQNLNPFSSAPIISPFTNTTQQPAPMTTMAQPGFTFAAPNLNQPLQFPIFNSPAPCIPNQGQMFQSPAPPGSYPQTWGIATNPVPQYQFPTPTLSPIKIATHSFPELPPLPPYLLEKHKGKSKSFFDVFPKFEDIQEKAKVRSYERHACFQDNRMQDWVQSLLSGTQIRANHSGTAPADILREKSNTRPRFQHWSDPAMYLPKSPKMDSDETFKLKTSTWKVLKVKRKEDLYENLDDFRRSILTPRKLTSSTSSMDIRDTRSHPDNTLINSLFEHVLGKRSSSELLTEAEGTPISPVKPSVTLCYPNPGFGDNSENTERSTQKPSRNVILTKDKYYCNPSVRDLRQTDAQGSCLVENFEIGHTEWGKVVFLGTMDVSGINLDDAILFRHKEVVIHPSDEEAPAFGLGLNRAAVITLEKVFPIDPRTKKPLLSLSVSQADAYERFLRSSCASNNSTFMNYEPEIGRWTFKVDRFSASEEPAA